MVIVCPQDARGVSDDAERGFTDVAVQTIAYAVTPLIKAGTVFVPESAPWLTDYLDCMATFPNADHNDDVDSTSQALNYLIGRGKVTPRVCFNTGRIPKDQGSKRMNKRRVGTLLLYVINVAQRKTYQRNGLLRGSPPRPP